MSAALQLMHIRALLLPILKKIKPSSLSLFFTPKITTTLRMSSSSWTCSICTFINPPSQKSNCQICLTDRPSSSSSSSVSKWSCKACTFLNLYQNTACEICGTRASASLLSPFEDDLDDDEGDQLGGPSVGSVFFPLQPCRNTANPSNNKNIEEKEGNPIQVRTSTITNKRKIRQEEGEDFSVQSGNKDDRLVSGAFRGVRAASIASGKLDCTTSETQSKEKQKVLKILTYNVWFREDLELLERMRALGDLIQLHSPDVICFQEVTPNIYDIFQRSSWWKVYNCSVSRDMAYTEPYFCMQLSKLPVTSYSSKPFHNSIMGRKLCLAEVEVQLGRTLVVATSHLESPCPGPPKWDQMYSKERVEQANEAMKSLEGNGNVIFCGDMNWDDKLDGQFPLSDGWIDAWSQLRPGEVGYTYDTKLNKMLTGNRTLQKRLDRFLCKLQDFETTEVCMIGMDAIPGLSYCKERKVKGEVKNLVLPVFPSDHYGLLLTICPK